MDLLQAIQQRHSVRKYLARPLSPEVIAALQAQIAECNQQGQLHLQLITQEPKAFSGLLSYGKFKGVENYLAMIGPKSPQLNERIGYYGERLVLLAQTLGLNTCWAGLSYRKVSNAYRVEKGETLVCLIALGYGETQGVPHRTKTMAQVSNATAESPEWFRRGVEAALLAPTAINQQKFAFKLLTPCTNAAQTLPRVQAQRGFSMVGYTQIDLGIAKYHFEVGAGKSNFEWATDEDH